MGFDRRTTSKQPATNKRRTNDERTTNGRTTNEQRTSARRTDERTTNERTTIVAIQHVDTERETLCEIRLGRVEKPPAKSIPPLGANTIYTRLRHDFQTASSKSKARRSASTPCLAILKLRPNFLVASQAETAGPTDGGPSSEEASLENGPSFDKALPRKLLRISVVTLISWMRWKGALAQRWQEAAFGP